MLDDGNTDYYNVKGITLIDPSINSADVFAYAPAVDFVHANLNIMGLNDSTMEFLDKKNEECGFREFMDTALTFPPKGPLPSVPSLDHGCQTLDWAISAAVYVNPCFNFYHILGLLTPINAFQTFGDGSANGRQIIVHISGTNLDSLHSVRLGQFH